MSQQSERIEEALFDVPIFKTPFLGGDTERVPFC